MPTLSRSPQAEKLYNEALSHIKQTDDTVPYYKRGYWYYSRTEEGKQYPKLCRKKGTLSLRPRTLRVAKLRALKTDPNMLVFFINMHGGHGGPSGRYDRIRERDRNYAFMLTQFGITQ